MLNSTEYEISAAAAQKKTKIMKNNDISSLKLSDVVFIPLINVEMPTTVDILTFMSRIKVMLSGVEHEKS